MGNGAGKKKSDDEVFVANTVQPLEVPPPAAAVVVEDLAAPSPPAPPPPPSASAAATAEEAAAPVEEPVSPPRRPSAGTAATAAPAEESTPGSASGSAKPPLPGKPKAVPENKRPQRSSKKPSKEDCSVDGGTESSASGPSDALATPVPPPLPPLRTKEAAPDAAPLPSMVRPRAPDTAAAPEPSPQLAAPTVVGSSCDISPEEFAAACRQGDEASVKAFLVAHARSTQGLADCEEALFDAYGDSVLHHAVHAGSAEVIELLLSVGRVPVDIPNARNETALQVACRRGDSGLIRRLLRAEADPDRQDANGVTPFLSTIFAGGGEDILELLAEAKANVSAHDDRGISSLHFAALRGDTTLLKWLLRKSANADLQTGHGTTPLMLAARRGHGDSVSLLLRGSASIALTDEAGCTALMHALGASNIECATEILEDCSSLDTVDSAGRSALFHAVLGGRLDGVTAVIAKGGRVNILDEEGRSPLYQACLMGAEDVVRCLLRADANPNLAGRGTNMLPMASNPDEADEEDRESGAARACLEEARTCLQVCAALANQTLMASLLESSADINAAPGALGWTALHLCAAVGNEEGAALLLARGTVTSLQDAEGNTAAVLAERAGHETVLGLLREAAAAEPQEPASAPKSPLVRRKAAGASLPPIHTQQPEEAPPEDEPEPLATFAEEEWQERGPADGSLLDRVCGPMVHDALRSDQWRTRWEALMVFSKSFADAPGSPADLVTAVGEVLGLSVHGKVPKVFSAAAAIFEELLKDARSDVLGAEEFCALLRGRPLGSLPEEDEEESEESRQRDVLLLLFDQSDTAGTTSSTSPQQVAADALSLCVLHGRVPLNEVAWILFRRLDRRLRDQAATPEAQDKKETSIAVKSIVANLKLLGHWLSTFGLQTSGLFRRALVLPLLVLGAASEHSRVRAAAGDAFVRLLSLSGGVEERIWALLPQKPRKALQRLASGQEGVCLTIAEPCAEDALPKSSIVAEDRRAEHFVCVSELTPRVWAGMQSHGDGQGGTPSAAATERRFALRAPNSARAPKVLPGADGQGGAAAAAGGGAEPGEEEAAHAALEAAFKSKNWKDRVDAVTALAVELGSATEGVRPVEDQQSAADAAGAEAAGGAAGGPLLSQYILRSHRLSVLQDYLALLLSDKVTSVFVAAADLLRLICTHMPLYIAPLFLEPLLPSLVVRMYIDTGGKVRAKTLETTLEIAGLHNCALSEMIVQCVASGSAWSSTGHGDKNAASKDSERATGPRLQLLAQAIQQAQDRGALDNWADDTWKALAEYALQAAEHKNNDVRKEAAGLLTTMRDRGVPIATQLAASGRLMTGRLSTGNGRPGTGTLGRLGTGTMRSSRGLNTSMRSSGRLGTGRLHSSAGGAGANISMRPRTGMRPKEEDEESNNSVASEPQAIEPPALPEDAGSPPAEAPEGAETIQFMDVRTACPGGDQVVDLADGEAALAEALPLAEPLDEVALDFVAPLIALFGDGWTRCFYSQHWQCRIAALLHLSATIPHRLEELNTPGMAPPALGELLDGAMRAVHEGLGDQNVQVYAEACHSVSAVVPAFCGVVDGRLLVAHLAPLLRQLCSRMGDSKEVVRTQTTQALFRLLRPPTGNIVSPVALAMLILRHLTPQRESSEGGGGEGTSPSSPAPAPANNGKSSSKSAATGWLCRLAALRDLVKEHHKSMVLQPGSNQPGEWLRLKDGLSHGDPTVRHESARLFALVCKMYLRSVGDEQEQLPQREAWVDELPRDLPPKSLAQVRRLLKLPEKKEVPGGAAGLDASTGAKGLAAKIAAPQKSWEVPAGFAVWAGCPAEVLAALRMPAAGDEAAILSSLRILGKAASMPEEAAKRGGNKSEEAFANVSKAIQQVLSSPVGADRRIFLSAIDVCQKSVNHLAPLMSGLDVNMGLGQTFPVLLDCTSQTADVKIAVASDKLVKMLAKHPKVGCEAVTKMVISAVARADRPARPLVLLHTLLGEFGLRLCAQRDIVWLLLKALAVQLERAGSDADGEDNEALRQQLNGVLTTCNQFSPETVHAVMGEEEPAHRKILMKAIQAAPDPRLVALGASAAEQDELRSSGHLAGSAIRAASRGRDGRAESRERGSPMPSPELRQRSPRTRPPLGPLVPDSSGERLRRSEGSRRSHQNLPRAEGGASKASDAGSGSGSPANLAGGAVAEASPKQRRRHRSRQDGSPSRAGGNQEMNSSVLSEASTTASAEHPLQFPGSGAGGGGSSSSRPPSSNEAGSGLPPRWSPEGSRPPAPIQLSSALSGSGKDLSWRFKDGEGSYNEQWQSIGGRSGSSEGRLMRSKEKKDNSDSLAALMDVLSTVGETRGKTR